MYLSDVERLVRYWNRNPPLRDLVAAYMGVKPEDSEDSGRPAVLEELPEFEEGADG
jgi:hypothetical protein